MDELRQRRQEKREAQRRPKVAQFLWDAYRGFTKGLFHEGQPHGVLIIRFGEGDPIVNAMGLTAEDWGKAKLAIDDARNPGMKALRRQWTEEREEAERQRREQYEKEHPFACSHQHCRKRFATEKGKSIHERSCHWIKQDKRQADG